MYASLGNIIFTTLEGFTSLSIKEETVYAEFAKMQSLPTLQAASQKAPELSISIYLKSEFTNVEDSIAALRTARKKARVLPLIWGNGKKEGYYVITSMDSSITNQLADGTFIEANVSLNLKQYQEADLIKQLQGQTVSAAKAVGNIQAINRIVKNVPNSMLNITNSMQKSLASMNTISTQQKNLSSSLQEKVERARKKVLKATDDFNKQMTTVKNETQKIQATIKNAKAIIDNATAVQQTLQTLYNGVVNSNGNFSVLTNNVFTSLGVLQGQTKDIVNSTIVRKG